MPIRFPTEAANDPGMKPATPDEPSREPGADSTSRGKADGMPEPRERAGKDINQPGFVRERDPDRER